MLLARYRVSFNFKYINVYCKSQGRAHQVFAFRRSLIASGIKLLTGKYVEVVKTRIALILACVLFLISSTFATANVSPSVNPPSLVNVSSEQGLSQDSVYDIFVDNEGFVWVANDEGLDRFDGVKVTDVNDVDGLLSNNAVYALYFDQQKRRILLSTSGHGLVVYDLTNNRAEKLLHPDYAYVANSKQFADSIIFDELNQRYIVAFYEDVYAIDRETLDSSVLFSLTNKQKRDYVNIRTVAIRNEVLFVGTSKGLSSINTETNRLVTKMFPKTESGYDLNNDIKTLLFKDNRLWVGAAKGLNEVTLDINGELSNNDNAFTAHLSQRNIWDLTLDSQGNLYIGTDLGLFRLEPQKTEIEYLFALQKFSEVISNPSVRKIALDTKDNLWMASAFSGAFFWSPKTLLVENIYNSLERSEVLASNNVLSIWANPRDSQDVWIGTTQGLVRYNLATSESKKIIQASIGAAEYSESHVHQIIDAEDNFLWASTGDGIRRIDKQTNTVVSFDGFSAPFNEVLSYYSYGVVVERPGVIWTLTDNGLFKLNLASQNLSIYNDEVNPISFDLMYSLLGIDSLTGKLIAATPGKVFGIDTNTMTAELLHELPEQKTSVATIATSWLRDAKGDIWISYNAYGIVKLNGTSLAELKIYSKDNILKRDEIYSLQLDTQGTLWFAGHSGIVSIDTESDTLFRFDRSTGIFSTEFNADAFAYFKDGRFAFGGNKGLSIFLPEELSNAYVDSETSAVKIIDIELLSRDLAMPIADLNGYSIEMEYDDFGLSISFSENSVVSPKVTQFGYRILSSDANQQYPVTTDNRILIPSLPSGDYIIEIFDLAGLNSLPVATVSLKVNAHPLLSLSALFVYIALALGPLSYLYYRVYSRKQAVSSVSSVDSTPRNNNKQPSIERQFWSWNQATNEFAGKRISALNKSSDSNKNSLKYSDYLEWIYVDDRSLFEKRWKSFLSSQSEVFDLTYRVRKTNGNVIWYRDIANKNIEKGRIIVSGLCFDLTENFKHQEQFRFFAEAFKNTLDWIIIFNNEGVPYFANPSVLGALGLDKMHSSDLQRDFLMRKYPEQMTYLQKVLKGLKPNEHWKDEVTFELERGRVTMLMKVHGIHIDYQGRTAEFFVVTATDVTAQVEVHERMKRLAINDPLTGLLNSDGFTTVLDKSLQSEQKAVRELSTDARQSSSLLVLFEIANLLQINQDYGYAVHEKVIQYVADRLVSQFSSKATIGRLNENQFALVFMSYDENSLLISELTSIRLSLSLPTRISNRLINVDVISSHEVYKAEYLNADTFIDKVQRKLVPFKADAQQAADPDTEN